MKKTVANVSKCTLIACVVGVVTAASMTLASTPRLGCWRNVECLDVWAPVICSDGRIYSNDCYAYRACATGCQPYGGDPM